MAKYKILVADDDPDILEVIRVVLEDKDYKVTTVMDAQRIKRYSRHSSIG